MKTFLEYVRYNETLGLTNAIANKIEDTFGITIYPQHLERVLFGQGNEKEKIDSPYSSSLQSLLLFNNVSKKHPISFKEIPNVSFSNVIFEYKNKVIGYPSSVDVVLISEDYKHVLFIESKFYEILRDSAKKVEPSVTAKSNGHNVVGVSYYKNGENSYRKSLNIKERMDLVKLGFDVPEEYGQSLKNDGYRIINPINGNLYVYPYGIKQFLSHIIGIRNIFKPSSRCDHNLENKKIEHIYFATLINGFPGFDSEDATLKINNFINHYKEVESLLKRKNLNVFNKNTNENINIEFLGIKKYQDLIKEVDYFKNDCFDKVKDFYLLNI